MYDYDIGIIGGGAAGLTIASGAAQLGAKTLLIEKEPALGGDCLHYGCVPSKTLIASAKLRHQMGQAERYGLPAVERAPVDFSRIAARIAAVIARIQVHDSPERFCGLGARVHFGSAEFRDEHEVALDGKRRISARSWVIATGSSAMVPPIPGLALTPHFTNREIFSLQRLPATMTILGAGPIGIEMAQAFARLGTRVTVVDRADQVLPREDRDLALALQHILDAEGVVFRLGVAIVGVQDLGGEREVTVRDESGAVERVAAEALLVALGRAPNIGGLGLDTAGVRVEPRGIVVDDRLRTSQPNIYAAGDVTGLYPFTHAAGYAGGIVVSNAVFRLPRKANWAAIPWCTYSDPELASIGLNERAARAAGLDYSVWSESFSGNDRALAEGQSDGLVKLLLDEKEKPLGVQILGPAAGELIAEWVTALAGKVRLTTLATAVHPYPTLAEINKRVAGNLLASKLFSERVKKGLRFFFNLKGRACTPGATECSDS